MEKLGLSGDSILIQDSCIMKICETNQDRFLKNIEKQKNFNNEYISAVPILEQGTIENKNYIVMPLLQCENSIVWLTRSNINQIDNLISLLTGYFESIIKDSQVREFDYSVWINKINDLDSKIMDSDLKIILSSLKNLKFSNEFYYGNYHGDFTLSNLFIFNEGDCVSLDAIDFLESFMFSPLNDLVKIRQDTKHLWTLSLLNNNKYIDENKVVILLNYIDKKIENMIVSDDILSEFYLPFQILNLLRIVPYNKDERVFIYLKKEIQGLFNEFNTYNAMRRQINKV